MRGLLWGIAAVFTLLYLSLIFNQNVWTDEIFTLNLVRLPFSQIIQETAADVHPPLYYFMGRIVYLVFGDSLKAQKVLTLIPMSLALCLGAGWISRRFSDRTALLYELLLGCLPCAMQYAVQVRMYSWSLLVVTLCGLAAYDCVQNNRLRNWLLLTISSVAAAYLHYFAFASVLVINGLLFLTLLFHKPLRGKLKYWLLCVVLMLAAYLSWLPYLLAQINYVESGYWIPEITWETVWGYCTWCFGLEPISGLTTVAFLVITAAALAGCLLPAHSPAQEAPSVGTGAEGKAGTAFPHAPAVNGKTVEADTADAGTVDADAVDARCQRLFGLLCCAVPALTALGGILLSFLKEPIYRDQYAFPSIGLLCLFLAIGLDRLADVWCGKRLGRVCYLLGLMFLLFVGAITYRNVYREEYKSTLTDETVAFFEENLGENDLVVYNYEAFLFNYKYYFDEEILDYVQTVDLEQDFDVIWFLDTANGWEFVPSQIEPYNLQIEYVGHYGFEHNEFDLYKVYKG